MVIMQHRRNTAASVFQNSISQNTKCDIMVGFSESRHILYSAGCTISNHHSVGLSEVYVDQCGTLNLIYIVFHHNNHAIWHQ